ncbi:MAG: TVP38/TMEM64 family protein [Clostridia bacterium]|jgi:uncharacterized membrane protein YdjX (TVP38/TMEM64 family)
MKVSVPSIVIYLISTLLIIYGAFEYFSATNEFITIALLVVVIVIVFLTTMFYSQKNVPAFRTCFLLIAIGGIIVFLYYILQRLGVTQHFSSITDIKDFILSTGSFGVFVYIFISFLQVTFIPIPAMVTVLAGVAIYGPFWASILSLIGIMLGAMTAFILGKIFGFRLIKWVVGDDSAHKYAKMLNKKGKFLLIAMFLLPIFPDDLLCLVAGTTEMSYGFFFLANLITRPVAIFPIAYFVSGTLVPYSGWGLYVWPIIIILLGVTIFLFYKYQDKLEKFIYKILKIKNK